MNLPERSRNAVLRGRDWRFLLPGEDEPGDVSLVDPRRRELAAADAAVYAEWRRPRLGGRRRLRRLLAGAGFDDVRWYWRWPPAKPDFWLPLDAAPPLDFFLTARRRPLARVWRWALRLGLLAPVGAIATRAGRCPDPVDAAVRSHAGDGIVSWILLTGGRRSVNKVVAFAFVGKADRPALVVKFARSDSEEDGLRREERVLRELERSRPGLGGVPRALFVERRSGRLGLGETALEGEPLIRRLNLATLDGLCARVTEWLVDLAGAGGPCVDARVIEQPLAAFARDYASAVSAEEIQRARAAVASLVALPSVCEQRDCSPWNVLLAGDRVSVADWESAEPAGMPALDLVYFLTNAVLHVHGVLDRGPFGPAYAASIDPATAAGRTVARCESHYCERVGIDARLLPALRLLCWTIHARSEFRRFELDAAGPPPDEVLARALFLELWRAELARQT